MKEFKDLTEHHMKLYRKWMLADMLTALLAAVGLALAMLEYELGFAYSVDQRQQIDQLRFTLRLAMSALSAAGVAVLVYRYWFKIQWSNLPVPKGLRTQVYGGDYTSLMRQNRKKSFVSANLALGVVLLALHPLPLTVEPAIWVREYVREFATQQEAQYLVSDFILGKYVCLIM